MREHPRSRARPRRSILPIINDAFYYVDLPGYGYARASVEVKAKWGKMIENYLHKSQMLRCVFLLIDIRHEPSSNDKLMYDWIVSQASSRS